MTALHFADPDRLPRAAPPPVQAGSRRPLLGTGLAVLAGWAERRRQRRSLAELDARLLNDLGLSPDQARVEAAKPFWRR